MRTVGLDLGATNLYAVVLEDDTTIGRATLRTPRGDDRGAVIDVMDAAVHDALDDAGVDLAGVEAVGVGTPGIVIDGTVGGAANVPGFLERFSLGESFRRSVERPVRVVNDGTAAGVAEHRLGAARGADDVLGVFVGTGVGGGLVVGGRPYEGGRGGAGEFGHMVVHQGGAVCPCGRRGCVEAYAGRRAIVSAAERARAAGTPTILFDVAHEQGQREPTAAVVREALQRGDPLVADLLDGAVEALGAGIASVVNLLDVDMVVLGGDLADRLGERFRMLVEAAMRPHLFLQPSRVQLVAAELGEEAAAVGAAIVARELGAR